MNRLKWLKVINIILVLAFLYQAITGLGHGFIDHELFEKVHPAGGALLIIFAIIHFVFNWGWVKATYFRKTQG